MLLPGYQKQNKTPNTEQHEFMGTARKKKNKTAKTVLVHRGNGESLWNRRWGNAWHRPCVQVM